MMALPVFALLMVAEAAVTSLRGHNVYALKDFAGSMSQLGINIASAPCHRWCADWAALLALSVSGV